jgi:opacity protein-like surface antigen
MKKALFGLVLAGLFACGASAADKVRWPAWIAFNDTEDIDVVGFRFNLPSGQCEQVTGIDLIGLIGRSQYFNGIQLNLLRNDVKDTLNGMQIGCYNSAGFCDMLGLQAGFWNESKTFYGFQVGLVNLADYSKGFQIGLINRAEGLSGYQIGAINIIRDSKVPFFPIINAGF